ncbi:MAG: DNA cytosine methyltransferase [Candidatus Atribacteria bacterium]
MYRENRTNNKRKIIAIDFFCGCGGVTHGMRKAGVDVIAGFDNDPNVKYAYDENNKGSIFYELDINEIKINLQVIKNLLKDRIKDILIFSACAPCQPFSLHNRRYKDDSRKVLMLKFIDLVEALPKKNQPEVIFFENVGSMRRRGNEVLQKALNRLKELDYLILYPRIINSADFGIPQNRRRLIFIAVQKKHLKNEEYFSWDYFESKYSEKTITVRKAIGKLPPIPHGYRLNKKDPLHITRKLFPINLERIKQITIDGGGREMWDEKYNLECYRNHKGHKDVYGRMHWNKPAPTLTCKCISLSNGRFGHPEQNRAISLREAAILQTLDDYKFKEPISLDKVAKQIGNAVPPKLAMKFTQFILEFV